MIGDKPTITKVLQVAYRPELTIGDDFGLFLRPRGFALDATELQNGSLSFSWRCGNDYLVFDRPIRPYNHQLPRGEWTALGIPWPNLVGLLTLELYLADLTGSQRRLMASGDVLVDTYKHHSRPDLWVYAWSPAPNGRPVTDGTIAAKPLPKLEIALSRLPASVLDGTRLAILSVGLDSVAPPEYLAFGHFPYDFGALRTRCDVPHGPGSAAHFFLPMSPAVDLGNVRFEVGSLGGLARTVVNLGGLFNPGQ